MQSIFLHPADVYAEIIQRVWLTKPFRIH